MVEILPTSSGLANDCTVNSLEEFGWANCTKFGRCSSFSQGWYNPSLVLHWHVVVQTPVGTCREWSNLPHS